MVAQKNVMISLFWVVGANLLFMAKRIICMPTWPKRILYPVFVVIVTGLYAYIVLYLSYLLAMFIVLLAVLMGVCGSKGRSRSGGGMFSSAAAAYPNEIVINDGSFWGKSLHRENDYGLWIDRSGQRYEETCTGFEKKY